MNGNALMLAASLLLMSLSLSCTGRGRSRLGPSVVVTGADMSGFERVLWGDCQLTRHPEAQTVAQQQTFQECFLSGYVTDIALSGEGRAQLDALARANGYDPTKSPLPLLPLSGDFVASHSGVFEVYDRMLVFTTDEAAHDDYLVESHVSAGQYFDLRVMAGHWGDESSTRMGVLGPSPTRFETQITTVWRRGRVLNVLSVQGASDIDPASNRELVKVVDQRAAERLRD